MRLPSGRERALKVRVDGKPNAGITMRDLRNFVQMTQQFGDEEWLDCHVPSEKGGMQIAALLSIEIEANVNCPYCGDPLDGEAVMFALSRKDNTTRICNDCGTGEALRDFAGGL
jgi:hypothetical protein